MLVENSSEKLSARVQGEIWIETFHSSRLLSHSCVAMALRIGKRGHGEGSDSDGGKGVERSNCDIKFI